MNSRWVSILSVAALGVATLAFTAPAATASGGRVIVVEMSGAAEVPGPGDPDGSGTATLQINPGLGEVCYTLGVEDIASALAAHIHVGTSDVAGPVVVPLLPPSDGSSTACVEVDRELAVDLIRNSADYYVNVHNSEYPAGAVRGQLG